MLFLALKKVEMVKFTPLQIPNTQQKKKPAKFSIPPTGGPPPFLNAIWKTLHAASKMNAMKKMKKDMERTNVM